MKKLEEMSKEELRRKLDKLVTRTAVQEKEIIIDWEAVINTMAAQLEENKMEIDRYNIGSVDHWKNDNFLSCRRLLKRISAKDLAESILMMEERRNDNFEGFPEVEFVETIEFYNFSEKVCEIRIADFTTSKMNEVIKESIKDGQWEAVEYISELLAQ